MKSFKQYITELFDSPYPHEKIRVHKDREEGDSHLYSFNDHKGDPVRVRMVHNPENTSAEIVFTDKHGRVGITGESGKHTARLFGTVKNIAMQHAKKHKKLQTLTFTSSKTGSDQTGSRARMYRRLAANMGGTTKENKLYDEHTIPVNQKK